MKYYHIVSPATLTAVLGSDDVPPSFVWLYITNDKSVVTVCGLGISTRYIDTSTTGLVSTPEVAASKYEYSWAEPCPICTLYYLGEKA
jgi:hypothetical protein